MAKLHAFTKNCDDESTSEGFQFRFLCDNCGEGYESEFVESKSSNAKERLTLVSKGLDFFGARKTSDGIDIIASQDRSAEWEKMNRVGSSNDRRRSLSLRIKSYASTSSESPACSPVFFAAGSIKRLVFLSIAKYPLCVRSELISVRYFL